MTDIEQKALALVNEVREERGYSDQQTYPADRKFPPFEALCRAIEQHEAYKQDVSDAVTGFDEYGTEAAWEKLSRFIIAKPDPLVEVVAECDGTLFSKQSDYVEALRAAIEARGGRIVWEGE